MSTYAVMNIALQTFGGLLSLMIIIFLRFFRRKPERLDRLYIRFLFCNMLVQLVNIVSWLSDGSSGTIGSYANHSSNFLMYLFSYLLVGVFINYLAGYLQEKGAPVRLLRGIVWGIVGISILLLLVSGWNQMFYYIDAGNLYHRGSLNWLSLVMGIAGTIPAVIWLFRYRRLLNAKEYIAFLSYLLLPELALISQIFFYGVISLQLSTTFVGICIYIFIQSEQAHKLSEKELELERSRTNLMVSQIQPHFLYNALTGIKELCRKEPETAVDAMDHFAYFLRRNLDSLSDTRLVLFEKEIGHVKDYFYLEKMRFKNRVNLVLELHFTDFLLPPMTLQPLVENAVRYGITKQDSGGTVTIRSEQRDGQVQITITDNGVGFDVSAPLEDGRTHTGIENVRSRLALQCGGTLEITSETGAGCEVRITLPRREALR